MTDAKIQAAIDRYDYFLTDLYHERLNPKEPCYEEDLEIRVIAPDPHGPPGAVTDLGNTTTLENN